MNSKKVGISIGVVLLIVALVGVIFYFLPKEGKETIYKVRFDNDGVIDVVDVKEKDNVERPIDPTKEGYTFDGWYYNGTKFDFTTGITKDITLEARWIEISAKKWKVRFDTAGGEYIEPLDVVDGEKIDKIPTPVNKGYKFLGWYYNSQKFDLNQKITKDIILVAKWEKIETTQTEKPKVTKYTVTFDSNGGTTVAKKTVEKNKTVSRPTDPARDGYTFIGWYYNDVQYNFNTLVTSNITLVAKWEKISTITYKIEAIEDSYVGQVRIFVIKDDVKVDGIVDIITTNGKTVTKEISKDGYITNGAIIETITNVKVK